MMTDQQWKTDSHRKFAADMEAAGIKVQPYKGRFWYDGPAVFTTKRLSLQSVIRKTTVKVQTDNMGLDLVVYPAG